MSAGKGYRTKRGKSCASKPSRQLSHKPTLAEIRERVARKAKQ
jgi:hypothetical protein